MIVKGKSIRVLKKSKRRNIKVGKLVGERKG